MPKPKISAKELIGDIRAGLDDRALMKKYALSAQGLQSAFRRLVEVKALNQSELEERIPPAERTIDMVWKCPACHMSQSNKFEVCPRCGVVVSQFGKAPALTQEMKKHTAKSFGRRQILLYQIRSWSQDAGIHRLLLVIGTGAGIGLFLILIPLVLIWVFHREGAADYYSPVSQVTSSRESSYGVDYKEAKEAEKAKRAKEKQEFSQLYRELLSFKNDTEFIGRGFEVGNKYHHWLTRVEALRKEMETGGTAGYANDMIRLASRFIASRGQDDDQSRHIMFNIEDYLGIMRPSRSVQSSAGTSGGSDCYELGYQYGRCSTQQAISGRSECPNDFRIPEECRGRAATKDGIDYGVKSVMGRK